MFKIVFIIACIFSPLYVEEIFNYKSHEQIDNEECKQYEGTTFTIREKTVIEEWDEKSDNSIVHKVKVSKILEQEKIVNGMSVSKEERVLYNKEYLVEKESITTEGVESNGHNFEKIFNDIKKKSPNKEIYVITKKRTFKNVISFEIVGNGDVAKLSFKKFGEEQFSTLFVKDIIEIKTATKRVHVN